MKAAPFRYVRATSVDDAVAVLSQHGADAKLVAGGQSLVPMMAMRFARPAVLVDINRLAELKHASVGTEKATLGAAVRQRDVELDVRLHGPLPLVREALRWVGHEQTRNRGTIGGSLVHADPSAELPLAALVLGAALRLRSHKGGVRTVGARDFFQGPMLTATRETECLVEIDWPVWPGGGIGCAFEELAMRHGDFAIASAACQVQLDDEGVCRRAAIGLGGMAGTPLAFPELARGLVGRRIDARLAAAIAHAAAEESYPGSDLYADAPYRRHVARVLMARALERAAAAARHKVA
jgi:CO/xanthine dehydrogenase FAD-binding subunit